jgi:hypothetical protein
MTDKSYRCDCKECSFSVVRISPIAEYKALKSKIWHAKAFGHECEVSEVTVRLARGDDD